MVHDSSVQRPETDSHLVADSPSGRETGHLYQAGAHGRQPVVLFVLFVYGAHDLAGALGLLDRPLIGSIRLESKIHDVIIFEGYEAQFQQCSL